MTNINDTLAERGSRYGEFVDHAHITQLLKVTANDFLVHQKKQLSPAHQEALDMIFHKIGRILNGDPNYKDSWHDIAGYAKLAEEECQEETPIYMNSLKDRQKMVTQVDFKPMDTLIEDLSEPKDVVLSLLEYSELIRSRRKLLCLENAGVDNWFGYSYAMDKFYNKNEE